jgi:hypothetical protein
MLRTNVAAYGFALLLLAACSGANATVDGGHDEASTVADADGGASRSASTDASIGDESSVDASIEPSIDAPMDATGNVGADAGSQDGALDGSYAGPCSAGVYAGTLAGTYTSHLTGVGIPIPFDGDVTLTLDPAGAAGTTCMLQGVSKDCGDVLTVHGGKISGTADEARSGDATFGGFPFFCAMTGALDCDARKLVAGWMQCTYCIGPVADGGASCSLLSGVGGSTGVGGHFAGPMTASYDVATKAFVMGTWNGAEALAGNDGTMPGPDGGPISAYLSDSGLYLGPNDYGGSGVWGASF